MCSCLHFLARALSLSSTLCWYERLSIGRDCSSISCLGITIWPQSETIMLVCGFKKRYILRKVWFLRVFSRRDLIASKVFKFRFPAPIYINFLIFYSSQMIVSWGVLPNFCCLTLDISKGFAGYSSLISDYDNSLYLFIGKVKYEISLYTLISWHSSHWH
jgi:hypothetical protein